MLPIAVSAFPETPGIPMVFVASIDGLVLT